MVLDFGELEGSEMLFKIALSYTTVDNAIENLNTELPHWDFEKIRKDTRDIWNEMFGRIAVEGGSQAQHIKFYTDLWHALWDVIKLLMLMVIILIIRQVRM